MKSRVFDGFIRSRDWIGARSCPYCARYSTHGHQDDCPWVEAKCWKLEARRLRRFIRSVATFVCSCGDGDVCIGCSARRVLKARKS